MSSARREPIDVHTFLRSWMFVPGSSTRYLAKCASLPVDVVILDLEDGVAVSTKEIARRQTADAIASGQIQPTTYLRCNQAGSPWISADLSRNVHRYLDGVMIPKVEAVDDVQNVSDELARLEAAAGLQVGHTRLMLAIETATGLLRAADLAACSPRVMGLILGAEDLALDLGLSVLREGEARELLYARSQLVVAARSVGVEAIDGVYPDYADMDGLRADAAQARRLGFSGKSLFHPQQIDDINAVFSPTPEEIAHAAEVVSAFEAARQRGEGAVALGGQLVDLPIVRRAERLLDRAKTSSDKNPQRDAQVGAQP